MNSAVYFETAVIVLTAVGGGSIAHKLHRPMIVGYILGGVLIGLLVPRSPVMDVHTLETLAGIGAILLMFWAGIEFSFRAVLEAKWVAIICRLLAILLSIALSLAAGRFLGWSPAQALALGTAVSLSSTMVMSRLMTDQLDIHSVTGRIMIGITQVQELGVVAVALMLPALGHPDGDKVLIGDVSILMGKAVLILAFVILINLKLLPQLVTRFARSQDKDLYLVGTLALGFVTAALTQAVGLSLPLSAFLAGIVIGGLKHAQDTFTGFSPLRNVCVAFFFVTVGTMIDFPSLIANAWLLCVITASVVLGKTAMWAVLLRLFHYPTRSAVLAGVGLAQIGEFSYVLIRAARDSGIVKNEIYNTTMAAILLTILGSFFLNDVVRSRGLLGVERPRAASS